MNLPRPTSKAWSDWIDLMTQEQRAMVGSVIQDQPHKASLSPITVYRQITGERVTVIEPSEIPPRLAVVLAASKAGDVFYGRDLLLLLPHMKRCSLYKHIDYLHSHKVLERAGTKDSSKGWPYRRGLAWEMAFSEASAAILGHEGAKDDKRQGSENCGFQEQANPHNQNYQKDSTEAA